LHTLINIIDTIPPLADPLGPQPNFVRISEHHQQMSEHHQTLSTEFSNFRNIPAFSAGDQILAGLAGLIAAINGINQRLDGLTVPITGINQRLDGIDQRLNIIQSE